MKKRTRLILILSAAAVLFGVLAIMFFSSDIWGFIRYRYIGNYVPPMIEAELVDKLSTFDGEMLTEEELSAFADEWNGEAFSGSYANMPNSLRKLTDSFVGRMNEQYAERRKLYYSENDERRDAYSPSSGDRVKVRILSTGSVQISFSLNQVECRYTYADGRFVEKTVEYYIPSELTAVEVFIADPNVTSPPIYSLFHDTVYIVYTPKTVSLHLYLIQGTKSSLIKQISTADFDEYMRALRNINPQQGDLQPDSPKEKLSLDRIEKYMAKQRK